MSYIIFWGFLLQKPSDNIIVNCDFVIEYSLRISMQPNHNLLKKQQENKKNILFQMSVTSFCSACFVLL